LRSSSGRPVVFCFIFLVFVDYKDGAEGVPSSIPSLWNPSATSAGEKKAKEAYFQLKDYYLIHKRFMKIDQKIGALQVAEEPP